MLRCHRGSPARRPLTCVPVELGLDMSPSKGSSGHLPTSMSSSDFSFPRGRGEGKEDGAVRRESPPGPTCPTGPHPKSRNPANVDGLPPQPALLVNGMRTMGCSHPGEPESTRKGEPTIHTSTFLVPKAFTSAIFLHLLPSRPPTYPELGKPNRMAMWRAPPGRSDAVPGTEGAASLHPEKSHVEHRAGLHRTAKSPSGDSSGVGILEMG